MKSVLSKALLTFSFVLIASVAMAGGVEMGSEKAGSVVSGGAGGANSEDASAALERCNSSLGTLAVDEDTYSPWYDRMGQYGIRSTVPILRLLAQQSNCFIVVERSRRGLQHIERERVLEDSGELRGNSNFGKGQLVAADYTMIPSLVFSDSDTGGIGGAIGGLFGSVGALLGASLKFADAQSVMTLVENRSGVQVAAAEGSARANNLSGGFGMIGGGVGGGLAGYTKTPEGKVIVAAMMDAFNNIVRATRNYKAQTVDSPNGLGTGGSLNVSGEKSAPAPAAAAPAGGNGLKARIKRAQQVLNDLGYSAGTPDGKVGNKTKIAVKQFQGDNGLNPTGRFDKVTLDTLLSY